MRLDAVAKDGHKKIYADEEYESYDSETESQDSRLSDINDYVDTSNNEGTWEDIDVIDEP